MELNSFWDSVEENPFTGFVSYVYKQIDLHLTTSKKHSLLNSLKEIDSPTPKNIQKLESIMRVANNLKQDLVS